MGTVESLGRGGIQYMSAGTGVRHSERNNTSSPLRFIQMWFMPREIGTVDAKLNGTIEWLLSMQWASNR